MNEVPDNYIDQLAQQTLIEQLDVEKWALPEGEEKRILPASNWNDDLDNYFNSEKTISAPTPWGKVGSKIDFRPGELSIWTGVNGHGKSLLQGFISLGFIKQGQKVTIASMEMRPVVTLARMARQAVGTNQPPREWLDKFTASVGNNLRIYSQVGTVQPKTTLAVARYAREKLGSDHVVIDSLMKCGISPDDYSTQKWFIDELTAICHDTGLHIHLVAHGRKKDNEHVKMDKYDIKGTSEISDMADNVFVVFRNKKKEAEARKKQHDDFDEVEDQPDAILYCDKQRNGDWEGGVNLFFNPANLQYTGSDDRKVLDVLGIRA